jgi:uncharacterized protein YjiS (DUF1127 family)
LVIQINISDFRHQCNSFFLCGRASYVTSIDGSTEEPVMPAIQTLQPASTAPSEIASRIRPLLRRAGHGAVAAWRVLSTRRELLEMDERMLKDIGVSRTQATYEATRWLWQLPKG